MWRPLTLLVLPVAAGPLAAQADSTRSLVEGRVVGLTGLGLRDVEVLWFQHPHSVLSGSDGTFSLALPTRGEATVVARRPGFRPVALNLNLSTGSWRGTIVLL